MEQDLEHLIELDRAHLIHPITEMRKAASSNPRIVTGGKGIRLETADGRSVIDGFSGLFNINVGHGRTEIADAVHEQMKRVAYYPSFWDYSSEPAIRLAKRVVETLPQDRGLDHVIFTTGASEERLQLERTAGRGTHYRRQHSRCVWNRCRLGCTQRPSP